MSRAAFSLVAHLAKLHRERDTADVTIIYQFYEYMILNVSNISNCFEGVTADVTIIYTFLEMIL